MKVNLTFQFEIPRAVMQDCLSEIAALDLNVYKQERSADGCDYVECDVTADLSPDADQDAPTPGYLLDMVGAMAEYYEIDYWIVTASSPTLKVVSATSVESDGEALVRPNRELN